MRSLSSALMTRCSYKSMAFVVKILKALLSVLANETSDQTDARKSWVVQCF